MIGKTISHYKILEKLGEGGMGVVYKAEDTKLKRLVALKFLPSSIMASEAEKARFIHEAQAAAALNHPNICTIYEIDEAEGHLFIAMEFVEGQSLKEKIEARPLKLDEALNIAVQVAEGLQAAHEKKITHRDIKPANVMITTKDQAKIMDFGLAKLAGRTVITKEGTTVGTVAYMSPEQARGEEVDQRTDIWALGVVLYEMITGQLPFKGFYEQAVVYSILSENPEPITGLRAGVPMELERIVNKTMSKKPEERYQHVDELLVDLRSVKKESASKETFAGKSVQRNAPQKGARALALPAFVLGALILAVAGYLLFFKQKDVSAARLPIAVVDFVNETEEKELNGLSGMLITSLEQSRLLSVLTRSRMFDVLKQMGKQDVDRIDEALGREICKQANVNAMAIASIRKLGKRYAIDLKVIDPQKDEYLFTGKEEDEGQESIFAMIDRLAEKTRKGLKEKEAEIQAASKKIAEVTTINLEAYQHYFKGEELINKAQIIEAEAELEKAIALDTTFALAYYRLAYVLAWQSSERAKDPIRKAMQYLDKAPEKERYLIRALNASIGANRDEATALYLELLKLYPEEKEALFELGDFAHHNKDHVAAITYLKKALAIDPTDERALQHLIWTYGMMGQCDKMLEYAKQYVTKLPNSEDAHLALGGAYICCVDFVGALQTYRQALELFPKSARPILSMGNVYIFKEEYQRAETEFEQLLIASRPLSDKRAGYRNLAQLYAYLGKYRETIKMMEKVIEINLSLDDKTDLAASYAEKAFWFLAGWNDVENAKRARAQGLELKHDGALWFHWFLFQTYLMMGEYEMALPIAKNHLVGSAPNSDEIVRAHVHRAKGEYDEAIKEFQVAAQAGDPAYANINIGYDLARCYLEKGQHQKAIETIRKMQRTYNSISERALVYPKSFSLLGEIYERRGDKKLAIENYEKFLDLWKDADEDLPDLIEAKARLAKLEGVAVK